MLDLINNIKYWSIIKELNYGYTKTYLIYPHYDMGLHLSWQYVDVDYFLTEPVEIITYT